MIRSTHKCLMEVWHNKKIFAVIGNLAQRAVLFSRLIAHFVGIEEGSHEVGVDVGDLVDGVALYHQLNDNCQIIIFIYFFDKCRLEYGSYILLMLATLSLSA